MAKEFFYKKYEGNPKIYAYSDSHPQYSGFFKSWVYIKNTVTQRVQAQYPIITPWEETYTIHLDRIALRIDGTSFIDKDVH